MIARFSSVLLFTSAILAETALRAADYPPADHGGADVTLADGDVIWGIHENVGTFAIPSGATVQVRYYDGTNYWWDQTLTQTGTLTVCARNVVVEGVIDASGAGYSGGGGGGGGSGGVGASQTNWEGGAGGWGRYPRRIQGDDYPTRGYGGSGPCFGCPPVNPGGTGAAGDGLDGGAGLADYDEWWRACGGYLSGFGVGTNADVSTDEYVTMGSGGAGGLGGPGGNLADGQQPGLGGAAGGSGGGAIALIANSQLRIGSGGSVLSNGVMGRPRNADAPDGLHGRPGRDALPYDPANILDTDNWHTSGGAGAGGGILLKCETLDGMTLEPGATISNLGGSNMIQNGGTVKLFYIGDGPSDSGVNIFTGRKFKSGGPASAGPGWMMYE